MNKRFLKEERKLKEILINILNDRVSLEDKEFLFNWISQVSKKINLKFKINKNFYEDWVSESYLQVFRSVRNNFKKSKRAIPWLIGLMTKTALNLYKSSLSCVDISEVQDLPEIRKEILDLKRIFFDELENVLEVKLTPEIREEIFSKLRDLSERGKLFSTKIGIRSHLLKILEPYFPEIWVKKRRLLDFLTKLRKKYGRSD